jgi:hypothetical protein
MPFSKMVRLATATPMTWPFSLMTAPPEMPG